MKKIVLCLLFTFSYLLTCEKSLVLSELSPPLTTEISREIYSTDDLSCLHPAFRNQVISFLSECSRNGIKLKVLETYRSPQRQDSLYRSKKRVTKLKGGESKHQWYIAVDVVPVVRGHLVWHDKKLWKRIGVIGEKNGMRWGGKWRSLYDPGHFEYDVSIGEITDIKQPDTIFIPI